MSLDPKKNFATVTPSVGYSAGATSIALVSSDGGKLPNPSADGAFNLVWWDSTRYSNPAADPLVEIVRCTARSGDTLTITRAQESTSATAKNTASSTYTMTLALTAKDFDDIESLASGASVPVYTDSGSVNALAITTGLSLSAYVDGQKFMIRSAFTNTSNTVTLNVDGLGAKTVYARLNTPYEYEPTYGALISEIMEGGMYEFVYDASRGAFSINSATLPGKVLAANILSYATDNSAGADSFVLTKDAGVAQTSPQIGGTIYFIAAYTNTGAATVQVDGYGPIPALKKNNGAALEAGDIAAGDMVAIIFDGTFWRLFTPPAKLTKTCLLVQNRARGAASAGWTIDLEAVITARLTTGISAKTVWMPLDGLQVGDIITGFYLQGLIASAGNAATLDCKLVRALTSTLVESDIESMAQLSVTTNTAFDSGNASLTLASPLTVQAGYAYALKVTGTTGGTTQIDIENGVVTVTRAK